MIRHGANGPFQRVGQAAQDIPPAKHVLRAGPPQKRVRHSPWWAGADNDVFDGQVEDGW
jgi:hypothetical protein